MAKSIGLSVIIFSEARVAAGAVWVMDRNFCVRHWLPQIAAQSAYFVVREHEQTPFTPLEPMQEQGATETGFVAEQRIQVIDPDGQAVVWRRIRVLPSHGLIRGTAVPWMTALQRVSP